MIMISLELSDSEKCNSYEHLADFKVFNFFTIIIVFLIDEGLKCGMHKLTTVRCQDVTIALTKQRFFIPTHIYI